MASPSIRFKTILPKKGFEFDIVAREIQATMRNVTKPEVRSLFKGTVQGWNEPPTFRGTIRTVAGKSIRLLVQPVGPNKEVYEYVTRGTKPHPIVAKPGRALRFRSGYSPSTRPGRLSSRRSRSFGAMQMRLYVWHPGIEARDFDINIAKLYAPVFISDMEKTMERASKKVMQQM